MNGRSYDSKILEISYDIRQFEEDKSGRELEMADLIIRRAEEKDVLAIEKIETECFAVPWSYESLHKDIVENGMAFYIVAEIAAEDGSEAAEQS